MPAKFELQSAKNGKIYFNLVANNGEIVLTSQMYVSKAAAKKGIASVRLNGASPERFQSLENQGGKLYFVLKAGNHQVIGTSQAYTSQPALKKGIQAVARCVEKAKVVDPTEE